MVEDVGTCSARLPGGLGRILRVAAAGEAPMRDQAIGFLSHGDSRVAYAVTGSGPLLLLDLALAHHLEAFWRYPGYRHLVQRLARRFTVVRWDRPGFGLSDRHTVDLSPDGELALVERLVDVLHRAGDPVVEPGWGRALAARIPNATFHLLEGASHLPYAGDPDPLLTALHSFLVGEDDEPARLSRRELEVAHLVTLGLTNAEIGRRLAIRRRTVDAHLEHIRSKLGVTPRART